MCRKKFNRDSASNYMAEKNKKNPDTNKISNHEVKREASKPNLLSMKERMSSIMLDKLQNVQLRDDKVALNEDRLEKIDEALK